MQLKSNQKIIDSFIEKKFIRRKEKSTKEGETSS